MPNTTPVVTDNLTVFAVQPLARGSSLSTTLAWATKFGGWLMIRIGRQDTTALGTGISVRINRTFNANAVGHPASVAPLIGQTVAAAQTTVNSLSSSGQNLLNVASVTGFNAGDFITVKDGVGSYSRWEVGRVIKTAAGVLTLDRNLQFSHTSAQADKVTNAADIFPPIRVEGGCTLEVILDYGAAGSGSTTDAEVLAQSYDSDLFS